MPIQAPQWTDYLNCPVCCREFGAPPRSPISLGCGHTICRQCLKHLHRKQCPFDKIAIQVDVEELVVNTAILQLAGYAPPAAPHRPPCVQALPEPDRHAFDNVVRCFEQLAVYLKNCSTNNNISGSRLSRPMQRKLVTLLQCAVTEEGGRGKAARAARSLGERTVTELILQHQNPQQLSANLWAAVRARGCQFLGPVMQEEVLKLVLLALEDGSALSRKVLVMFVVQRLEPHFPQASKTSIGHVVQLLYRASCFKVSKRESDSSLMQLKEEFRTYEALRREHDAQIVQIANEAGLRIAPDQWSALLYGATAHKSHMQSIIDKLQTPQSFYQSVQELFIALQRTGDIAHLIVMSMHLDRLANIDPSPEAVSPTWQQLCEIMTSLREVVAGLVLNQMNARDSNHNAMHRSQQDNAGREGGAPRPRAGGSAPAGDDDRHVCTAANGNTNYFVAGLGPPPAPRAYRAAYPPPPPPPPHPPHSTHPTQAQQMDNYLIQGAAAMPVEVGGDNMPPPQKFPNAGPPPPAGMLQAPVQYLQFNDPALHFQAPPMGPRPVQQYVVGPPVFVLPPASYAGAPPSRPPAPALPPPPHPEPLWSPIINNEVFRFANIAKALPQLTAAPSYELYAPPPPAERAAPPPAPPPAPPAPDDDKELEQELQELERRIVTELKSQDEVAGLYDRPNTDKK